MLRAYFEDLDSPVVILAQNCLAYYAGFETCIGYFGLTDATVAHQEMGERKGVRIGHEKMATQSYLRRRGVLFSFLLSWIIAH